MSNLSCFGSRAHIRPHLEHLEYLQHESNSIRAGDETKLLASSRDSFASTSTRSSYTTAYTTASSRSSSSFSSVIRTELHNLNENPIWSKLHSRYNRSSWLGQSLRRRPQNPIGNDDEALLTLETVLETTPPVRPVVSVPSLLKKDRVSYKFPSRRIDEEIILMEAVELLFVNPGRPRMVTSKSV